MSRKHSRIVTAGAAIILLPAANAQIVADPTAPANRQPTIVDTANGLPQVNIQTPSAAGVSRNTYRQFDVQQQGAILNNARADAPTQLGGWIQRNPNLANGTARIILNEINSSNPSYLRGHLEVAGDRAQVVIANPAGVTCDGCGFINANRATLTTGTPIMNGGQLDAYLVRGGAVTVQGAGMDARTADYTDIIARAVQVNSGIWAKEIKVTAGANRVNADHTQAMPVAASAAVAAPSFGIDVAQLGGMYANKIILVGTEAGVGVLNAGELGAAAGEISVTADGKLINGGSLDGAQGITLAAAALDNRNGRILANGAIRIGATDDIDNAAGLISAGQSLQIRDRGADGAAPKTLQIRNRDGALIAARNVGIDSAGLSGDGKILSDADLTLRLADGFDNTGTVQANGMLVLETGGALNNRGLIDGQDTFIDAFALNNRGSGRIYGDRLAIDATTLSNAAETVDGMGAAPIIAARERLDIAAQTLSNREHATLFSGGDMVIGGSLDTDRRAIGQAAEVNNNSAAIEALGALDLSAKQIANTNEHFSTERVEVSRQGVREYQLAGSPNRYRPDQVRVDHQEVDILTTPEGWDYKFHRYDYTRVVTETRTKESDPAKIRSGGAMRITADRVLNDKSTIIAGGVLTGNIGALSNTEVAGQRVTTDSGIANYFFDIEKRGIDEQGLIPAAYHPAPSVQAIGLTPSIYKQNAGEAGSGTQIATRDTARMDTPVTLPDGSLFTVDMASGLNYLVQSDPRFTDYRVWLSSDYLLQQMNVDPTLTQKRLGDGFYEQQLIREQVAELTGRRFLDGYASEEEQYRALLENGATYARKLNLRVGVALSAEQMAQLTSDVVLLMEKEVTLPNGEVIKVLAPQLYTRVKPGDISGGGALLSGKAVDLKVVGDIVNSGTLAGETQLSLSAGNIHNVGGRISAVDANVQAVNDINNLGGAMDAADSLTVAAGRDLNVVSTTRTGQSEQGSRTHIDRVASLYVANPGATLIASAGRDVKLNAAQIVNSGAGGGIAIAAGNDLNLGTIEESNTQSIAWDADNYRKESASREAGSMIAAAGDVKLLAVRNIKARAADVSSEQGALAASAGNDINLSTGTARQVIDEGHKTSGGSGLFSSKTVTTRNQIDRTQAQGGTFSGDTVALSSGNDINVEGSDVVSTAGAAIVANRNVNIEAALDTNDETHLRNEETSGLFSGGGLGVTIGKQEQNSTEHRTGASSSASRIGSTDGNVSLIAGNRYRQTGSQILAPRGDIDISAKTVDIAAATDTERNTQATAFKKSGLSISITNPAVAAVQAAQQMKTASKKTKDSRVKGLAGAAAALTVAETANATVNSDPGKPAGGVDLAVSIGASKYESRSEQSSKTARGSSIAAGGNINISAVGGGKDSDLTIQGSDIAAGNDIGLKADDEINLLAAQNTGEQRSSNKGGSASIGFSVGTSGYMVNAGMSGSHGRGDGKDTSYSHTHVDAGNQLTMTSGGDTSIVGGVAGGKQVGIEVGTAGAGNLNIASLQDRSHYKSNQQSLGGSISVGIGKMSGSISASRSEVDGEYVSVNQQSGIVAGDGGFDIKVHGNTDLAGGKIASTERAVQDEKNSLTTETLTQREIANHSRYEANSRSISIGGGYADANSAMNGTGIGSGNASGSDDSSTGNGVSGGAIVIIDEAAQWAKAGKTVEQTIASINTDVSSDKDNSGSLTKGWDGLQLQEEVNAQAQVTAAFGKEAGKGIGAYATDRENNLRREARAAYLAGDKDKAEQLNGEADNWSEGGAYRIALHTAAGALTGRVNGEAVSAAAMPEIAKSIEKMDLPNAVKQGLAQVAAAVVGAAAGGAAGVAGAVHVEANNRQLHESEKVLAKRLAEQSKGKYTQVQIEEQMRGMTMKQNGVTEYGVYDTVVGGVPSDTDGAWLLSGITDGKPIYTQYMEPEDAVLRAYIVRNTTGSSVPSLITYEGPYEAPDAPVYSNTTGPLPTAKCAVTAADCAAGIAPPLTAEQKMENIADFSRKISLTAGMIASAAAISGNEHLAAIFASISTGAGGIEYLVTRDDRAVYIQKTIDVLTDKVIEKQPSLFLAREILKEALSQYWSQNEKK